MVPKSANQLRTRRMPRVSVLVTIYNREAYLEDALRSILSSTYQDFELIAVDDVSKDGSLQIAQDIAATDSRVRVVANEKNLGDYGNRAQAAALAQGEFIKFIDSDDQAYPHTLEVMVRAMDKHPDAAVGLAHSMAEDDEPYPWKLTPELSYQKHFLGRGCLSCGPTGAIIRRTAFEAAGGFRKEWGVLSDTEFWLRLAAQHPVILLPPGLAWWRRHEGQEFTKDDATEVYLQRGHELDMQVLTSKDCPLNTADQSAAITKRKQYYARRLLALATRQRSPGLAMRLYRNSQLSIIDLAKGTKRYR